ncbi:lymphatic vessel endothelial hyaluronic acid receptor 1 [Rhineura floridana]|uniref:lymphatic vessel endothelial hyaluronic acid receptor 1 n=1 Tax=Rhineura floridana TaxID=261503 RepID=UPI002AC7EE60|nr:lymphatic vessel endothelial hyaluronic acid receptor 1 [Rhineura floridana]
MASHFGVTVFIFSVWIVSLTTQDTFVLKDINTLPCRISGITLVSYKNKGAFNFIEGQGVCGQLGLRMAYKSEVERARKHGMETCSFGWVQEGYVVISRITPNQKCGQNKIGVAIWRTPHDYKGRVFCYNTSDTWINSCEPEETTTALLDFTTETNSTSTVLSQDTSAVVPTSESQQTKKVSKLYRVICITETFSPPAPTTVDEVLHLTAKRTAFRNDGVLFGGVPTALLVLALIFFAATVVLAVCYVKKYKKTFPFSNKKEKKVEIETKNFKETKTSSKTPEQEPKKNGKNAEVSQTKPEPPVKCLEAEV